jgi:hypothetical protein
MKRKVGRTFFREIIINNYIGKLVTTNKFIILIIYVFLVKSEDERRLWTCERALRVHSPGCDRQGKRPTTIYFNRLETVHFFCLFTREGDIEFTGCGNSEHRGLNAVEYCSDCLLAQISLRNGAVLHCENKFKALNTLLYSAEYTITREKGYFWSCLKILLGHSNRFTQCNHHEPSCGVRSS